MTYSFLFVRADGAQLSEISALVDAGKIRPIVDRVFDFADTVAALDYVGTGRAKGKVVVTIPQSPPHSPNIGVPRSITATAGQTLLRFATARPANRDASAPGRKLSR